MSIKLLIAGDSTSADHLLRPTSNSASDFPRMGWAQMLGYYFTKDVKIINRAHSGRSSKSFCHDPEYSEIFKCLNYGDYFVIQFGHNDGKPEEERRTDPLGNIRENGSFKHSLYEYYIKPALKYGANPIIATSISRNRISDPGLKPYVKATRELANELELPCVDLYKKTNDYINQVGYESARRIYAHIDYHDSRFIKSAPLPSSLANLLGVNFMKEIGDFENSKYFSGGADDTHIQFYGANIICRWFCDELERLNHPLVEKLKGNNVKLSDIPEYNDSEIK